MQYCGRPGTWHLREGTKDLNRNQKAAARQLSLAAYLLFSAGRAKDEASIAENLPPYGAVYDASLGEDGDRERAGDAVRKQLQRDVEALAAVGIRVEVEGSATVLEPEELRAEVRRHASVLLEAYGGSA